jgi:hypothetical protein
MNGRFMYQAVSIALQQKVNALSVPGGNLFFRCLKAGGISARNRG